MENNQPDERALVLTDSVQLGAMTLATPQDVVRRATGIATELARIIHEKKLSKRLGGDKPHVMADGWSTLGAMLGVTPRQIPELSKTYTDGDVQVCEEWVELVRVNDGQIIGRAKGICANDEKNWKGKPLYARASMAATRATGKAFRLAFSWIVVLAGFEPTPAEEMEGIVDGVYRDAPPAPAAQTAPKASRPLAPEVLRDMLNKKAAQHAGATVPPERRGQVMDILATIFDGNRESASSVFVWLFDAQGTNDNGRIQALWDWLAPNADLVPSQHATDEARAVMATLLKP